MADDLYTTWLDVPPGPRPPDHYALLGLPRFAGTREEVEQAAHLQLHRLDRFALHPDPARREQCQRMMNEVARARVVLVNPERRAAYDAELRGAVAPKGPSFPAHAVTYPVPAGIHPGAAAAEEAPDELWQLAQAATTARRTRGRRVGVLQLVPILVAVTALAAGSYYYLTRRLPETARRSVAATTRPTTVRPPAPPAPAPPAPEPAPQLAPQPQALVTTASAATAPAAPDPMTAPGDVALPAPPARAVVELTQADMAGNVRLERVDVIYQVPGTLSPPDEKAKFTLSVGPGVELDGGLLDLRKVGRLEIEGTAENPAVLRNMKVHQDLGASVTARFAVFDRCTFAKGGAWFSWHSSKWEFENCLLYACVFPRLTGVDYGFKWTDCTFVSMDFPEILARREKDKPFDVMRHLRRDWNSVTRCRFVNCAIRPTMVWCAVQSNYAGCRFEPGQAFASDAVLVCAPWLGEVAGAGPLEAWAQNPPERKPVYLVPADKPYDVFSFKDPLPVPELSDEAARRAADLSAYDAERRAAAKRAPELAGAPAPPATAFVCDASRFMDKHFDTLQAELSKAVIGLKPSQRFNIIFFQGERPSALSPDLLPAATQNKVLALDFIHATAAHGDRDSRPALTIAFATKPQILHLLSTEDAPALNAVAATLADLNADKGVKVNVIRFGDGDAPQDATDAVLRRIAKENGGFYRYVDTGAVGAP